MLDEKQKHKDYNTLALTFILHFKEN